MKTPADIIVTTIGTFLSILIVVDSLLSFLLPPFHPIREAFGRILNPLYAPIRKILPAFGGLDLSPLVLLILVQVLVGLITSVV